MVVCLCVISVVCLSFSPSLCVWSLGCCVLLSWVCVFLVSFFYVSLYVCRVSLMCLGGLLVVYGWLPFLRCSLECVCACFLCWLGCVSFMGAAYCLFLCVCRVSLMSACFVLLLFRFSFVLLCVSPGFCVWFWVCGGLFLGGCLVGLGFGVVGFWVWGGGFVLWGGCWCCCFLGAFWVDGGLWAILLLLFLLLFFCLECGFGGCWAWCCCW